MRKFVPLVAIIVLLSFLAGCGETVQGAVKDTKRIGSGVRRIFVRD